MKHIQPQSDCRSVCGGAQTRICDTKKPPGLGYAKFAWTVTLSALVSAGAVAQPSPTPPSAAAAMSESRPELNVRGMPDLIAESGGETTRNVYYGKFTNIGQSASAATTSLCSVRIFKGTTYQRSALREFGTPALKVGQKFNAGCDWNSGVDALKDGERINEAIFIVNHNLAKKTPIAEATTKNNVLHVPHGQKFNY